MTKVPLAGEPWGRQQKDRASTAAPGINSLWVRPGKVRGFLLPGGSKYLRYRYRDGREGTIRKSYKIKEFNI